MSSVSSHEIRLLACQSCGSPIDGGLVQCSDCSASHPIIKRDESLDRDRVRRFAGILVGLA